MTSRAPATEREEARSRHPANGRWRPDLRRLADQVAARLSEEGLEWPDVAAAALAARGVAGVDQRAFAAELGIAEELLVAAETGGLAADALPAALRRRLPIPPRAVAAPSSDLPAPSDIEAVVATLGSEFHTADVAAVIYAELPPPEVVSAVGRGLSRSASRLNLDRLPPDGRSIGARWRRRPG